MASTSNAAQSPGPKTLSSAADSNVCLGLATALGNNQKFIDGQKASPDAQSAARIANREAVIDQIKVQQKASGCTVGESAQGSQSTQPAQNGAGDQAGGAQQTAQPSQTASAPAGNAGGGAASGQQVCNGSTVTLSGEAGAPAASSNQFPVGTTLKVTNLDNNKSTTVKVTSVSGSCALLNNAAFEQVREPGKFLIRRALIEKVG
jgi:rare lipoprotein A (peptidoglycan hydrolase)